MIGLWRGMGSRCRSGSILTRRIMGSMLLVLFSPTLRERWWVRRCLLKALLGGVVRWESCRCIHLVHDKFCSMPDVVRWAPMWSCCTAIAQHANQVPTHPLSSEVLHSLSGEMEKRGTSTLYLHAPLEYLYSCNGRSRAPISVQCFIDTAAAATSCTPCMVSCSVFLGLVTFLSSSPFTPHQRIRSFLSRAVFEAAWAPVHVLAL